MQVRITQIFIDSYVYFESSDSNSCRSPSPRQTDEMFTPDITRKKRSADLQQVSVQLTKDQKACKRVEINLTGSQNMCLPAKKNPLTVSRFGRAKD